MNEEIKQKFCREFGSDRVLLEEPMKRHTTFRIGGPAEVFVMPGNLEEMQRILEICRTEDLPYFILGNGSNLLAATAIVESSAPADAWISVPSTFTSPKLRSS